MVDSVFDKITDLVDSYTNSMMNLKVSSHTSTMQRIAAAGKTRNVFRKQLRALLDGAKLTEAEILACVKAEDMDIGVRLTYKAGPHRDVDKATQVLLDVARAVEAKVLEKQSGRTV